MADRLTPLPVVLLLSALLSVPASAQPATPKVEATLPDPTRPPASVEAPDVAGGEAAAPAVLSSVLIPAGGGKRRAIIDGRSVGIGDQVGDAKIVGITETSVSLKGPQGTQVLRLTPGIEKRMLRSKPDGRQTGMTKP